MTEAEGKYRIYRANRAVFNDDNQVYGILDAKGKSVLPLTEEVRSWCERNKIVVNEEVKLPKQTAKVQAAGKKDIEEDDDGGYLSDDAEEEDASDDE